MRYIFAVLLCLNFVGLNGQMPTDSTQIGNLSLVQDAKIDSLIAKNIALLCKPSPLSPEEFCMKNPKIWGYRIQVFHSKDRKAWETLYDDLKEKYLQEVVLQEYTYPYYRIFIGQYKDKAAAQKDLKAYRRTYPGALAAQWQVRCKDVMFE